MMFTSRKLTRLVAHLLILSCVPTETLGLAIKNENKLSEVWNNLISKPSQTTTTGTPADLLTSLNLQSSTEPRRFYARPAQWPKLLTAAAPAIFRLGSGVFCNGYKVSIAPRDTSMYTVLPLGDSYQLEETSTIRSPLTQTKPLIVYEFETCPFCRKVREATSMLSLSVTYRPCPKNGNKYRKEIKEQYGARATFPFLMDPNTGVELFESDDILDYLFRSYGDGTIPWTLSPGNPLVPLTAGLGLLLSGSAGGQSKPSNPPAQPVTVWLYEGSPFCKWVREVLSELELAHTQISCPRGSFNRQVLLEKTGRFQVPYMEDPNTGVSLFESEAIVEYLQKQYGVAPSPVKYL